MLFQQTAEDRKVRAFTLSPGFLDQFKGRQPNWGPLGQIVYVRTYARALPDGGVEEWWQTTQRVVEGCFNIQKIHCRQMGLPWNEQKAQRSAQDMYQRIWDFKFTPPGRGLWVMGTDAVYERGSACLQNCAFTSSETLAEDFAAPFCFLADMSMLGVGVGGDTKGAGKVKLQVPKFTQEPFVVKDTREGWVDLIRVVLNSFVGKGLYPLFIDYSQVRGRGVPLKTLGGVASGPKPLHQLVENLTVLLMPTGVTVSFDVQRAEDWATIQVSKASVTGSGEPYRITSTHIVDIFNYIGKAVVAGGIRRSSELMLGEAEDIEFMKLKQDSTALADRRWCSNNSVYGHVGMDYSSLIPSMAMNGEPGIFWLDNARKYSRMGHPADNKDWRAQGCNPCFAGDTLIAVADGRGAVSIQQLAEEGKDVPVYSVTEKGAVEIRWARNPRLTRTQASLVNVLFDDGTSIRVTPDHKMRLLDGSFCAASDLQAGDNLPRFTKRLELISKGAKYLRVNCDTLDCTRDKVMEHRLIAQFGDPTRWANLYDSGKKAGWLQGGLVVHHKDFDKSNNAPENLQVMTFREHQKYHADHSGFEGEKNPMWGKTHKESTKKIIGQKVRERCQDPAYKLKISEAQTPQIRADASARMAKEQKQRWQDYYKEQEASTGLETVWVDGNLCARKSCEICKKEFIVPWRTRGQTFCSRSCMNKHDEHIQKRVLGAQIHFADAQRQTLHDQISVYRALRDELGREPLAAEWHTKCKQQQVSHRFRQAGTTVNPNALQSFGQLREVEQQYNHRVVSVVAMPETASVYNLSVEENHTVGIVTQYNAETKECGGIFTFQCSEQTLESAELCNLVETFPVKHETYEDFEKTLKMAYLYAKTVTLVPTHDPRANAVMIRNRRIGCSMSGVMQAMVKFGRRAFLGWCDNGYDYIQKLDRKYSDWLGVPLSIKTTSLKPSGTVSLLPGVTPGIHYAQSEYYIRRVRIANTSPLIQCCQRAGLHVEPDAYADDTTVISFPVHEEYFVKGKADVTIWEQFANVAAMQQHWADNQISATITFKPHEVQDLQACLEMFEDKLKGISVLPLSEKDHGYVQAPYETITKEQYEEMTKDLKPLDLSSGQHEITDAYCDGDKCQLPAFK